MKSNHFDIWIGEKDLTRDEKFLKDAGNEFKPLPIADAIQDEHTGASVPGSRRDFLKYLGFSLSAATIAASCEAPIRKAIPYVVKPDQIVPGVANYYASTFLNGGDYCAVLVKTREGRPIKIEGNSLSPLSKGGTSARVQASVLSLYDVNRLKGPAKMVDGQMNESTWEELDREMIGALRRESKVAIVTESILSPSLQSAITDFTKAYPGTSVVSYDPKSSAAILIANEQQFGLKAIPSYHFDKAKVIVSFGADFLGTWISPVEYAADYAKGRKIGDSHNPEMSRHYQVESMMSLTGSNADNRVLVRPSEQGAAIAHLYNAIAEKKGAISINAPVLNDQARSAMTRIAEDLMSHQGSTLVISDSNVVAEQLLINQINTLLQNYSNTLDISNPSYQRQGDERGITELINQMADGQIDLLIVNNCNPIYELPNGADFERAMNSVGIKIALNSHADETATSCNWSAPVNHFLESWGDAEPKKGHFSLIQPTISPIFNTRQAGASLLTWAESTRHEKTAEQPYLEYVKLVWKEKMFPLSGGGDFQSFWDKSLHDGVLHLEVDAPVLQETPIDVSGLQVTTPTPAGTPEINIYESINMGGGAYANNPWLQEMPDPVNRCTWGNYLAVPVTFDGKKTISGFNGLDDGDVVLLTNGEAEVTVPVIQQFGQMENTFALSLGYGRDKAGRCGNGVGVSVQNWLPQQDGLTQYYVTGIDVGGKLSEEEHFSCVQYHHTMGVKAEDTDTNEIVNADESALAEINAPLLNRIKGYQGSLTSRTIFRGTHLNDLEDFVDELHHEREHHQKLNANSIYPDYSDLYESGHHWGLHVDMNACIGCGACTVACMAENNVPVVGKRNVARHQEMSWLRIDRYYYGDFENPKTVYQPMMCQHCDNAPCENVCPVNATNHSSEGLNQMIYNRCVGTRYCANNCPFKVRRLNWADYMAADLWPINEYAVNEEAVNLYADNLTRMVLNPDVTVRSRGVMEKCSFCAQRIQEGKLTAKSENRRLQDRDVMTACQTSCPTGAITFGDQNNKEGDLNAKFDSHLNYILLEETNVRSSVNYAAKVINSNEELYS